MSVALVDNWCGAVNVLETVDSEAIVGKPDERTVLSHDLNVVAGGRLVVMVYGAWSDRWSHVAHRTGEGFERCRRCNPPPRQGPLM